jgi:hypothetical protein
MSVDVGAFHDVLGTTLDATWKARSFTFCGHATQTRGTNRGHLTEGRLRVLHRPCR